ncbi:MAG: transcriptional regulator BetI [Ancalomicrobiaceae bacterium]|nr:transcriptional regulator BetI [Ancalomicrobiaceae bacterium]
MSTKAQSSPLPRLRRFEPGDVRRRQLIEATVETIADVGFAAATINQIAGRAGVSAGLVAFYFGDKDGLLEATLRHLAAQLHTAFVAGLAADSGPRDRIAAVIDANLGTSQFDRRIATVWLAFWGQVPVVARFARVQRVYERRMISNLLAGFRDLVPDVAAERLAAATAAMIDGLWLRATLSTAVSDGSQARDMVNGFVDAQIALTRLALMTRSEPGDVRTPSSTERRTATGRRAAIP